MAEKGTGLMKKVIISSDYTNLKNYLDGRKEEYFYILTSIDSVDIENLLRKRRYEKVDIHEGIGSIDFKKEYIDFVGRLNRDYNSIYWWANSISYKGAFVSDLSQEIFDYYCTIALIEKYNRNYIIISNNLTSISSIKKYCEQNGIDCRLLDDLKRETGIVHFRRCCLSSVYFLKGGWLRKMQIFMHLSRKIKRSLDKHKSYYIVKSWIQKKSFAEDNRYKDLFFGKFPEYLKGIGKEFIILAGMLKDHKELILRIKSVKEFLIIPQEYFVGYMDYLRIIALSFIKRPRILKPVKFCGLDVTDFLIKCLRKDYENNEIGKNLIYYYYVKGLLRRLSVATFLFTFENQAWERMSLFALRRYSPDTKIIGYAHASITQSPLTYFYSREEEDVMPVPDRILTVGKEASSILQSDGNYINNVKVSEGCALRYEYLFKKDRLERRRKGDILVVFSINIQYSLKLLRFLCDSLGDKNGYRVILRPHPFTPVEMIIKKYNINLSDNFQISKNSKFEQDLENASLLIYIDTTASMEALLCGVPAVYIDLKGATNPDPLFRLTDSFKWTVSDRDGLRKIIEYIYAMEDTEFLERYNNAALYLKGYFYPIEEKYLEGFLV